MSGVFIQIFMSHTLDAVTAETIFFYRKLSASIKLQMQAKKNLLIQL